MNKIPVQKDQKMGRPFWVCIGIAIFSLAVVLINLAVNNPEPVDKGWLVVDVVLLVVAIGAGAIFLSKDKATSAHSKNSN